MPDFTDGWLLRWGEARALRLPWQRAAVGRALHAAREGQHTHARVRTLALL